MTIHPEKLKHDYTETIAGKSFVDAKSLDVFAGHIIREKSRKQKSAIEIVIEGTEVKLDDFVINKQKTCFVAIGILQIIIIRGLQSGFPWTQLRRRYVSYFSPNTPQLIPDSQPFVNPLSMPTIPVEQFSQPESGFSQKMHTILATLAASEQKRLHAKSQKNSLHQFEAKALVKGVFSIYLSYENLKSDIFICNKTGSWINMINTLKKTFHVDGLGQKHLILGYTAIKEMSKPMISKFISLFKPKNTFSGFRIDLVRATKVMTFILFKGRTDLQGLKVDIWRDCVQIGKKDQTRMAFRFSKEHLSAISHQMHSSLLLFLKVCSAILSC